MAKSGLFDIVGHLDLIKVFNYLPKKDVRLIAQEAIKAIKKANMSIELNAAPESNIFLYQGDCWKMVLPFT